MKLHLFLILTTYRI